MFTLSMLDRVPAILGPLCENIQLMTGFKICFVMGGPEPRDAERINVMAYMHMASIDRNIIDRYI